MSTTRADAVDTLEQQPNGAAAPAKASSPPSPVACEAGRSGVTCTAAVVVEAPAAGADLRPLSSSSLSAEELRVLGPDVDAWMDYAQREAGAPLGRQQVYVDGMPSAAPIDRALASRVAVNEDPVSAEYSSVNEVRIDVELRAPDRRWRIDTSMPSFGSGGGSTLAPGTRPQSRNLSAGLSGPVARIPLTFSVHGSQRRNAREPIFASAATGLTRTDGTRSTSESSALTGSVVLAARRLFARVLIAHSTLNAEHAGIGDIVSSEAGRHLQSSNTQLQGTWRAGGAHVVQRGGASFSGDRLDSAADSRAAAMVLTGQLVSGGNEIAAERRRAGAWTIKHVADGSAAARPWKAGLEVNSDTTAGTRILNPGGRYQLAALDSARGARWLTTGTAADTARATSSALFAERLLARGPRATLRVGARADWQSGDGLMFSPRAAVAIRRWNAQFTGSAGQFVERWTPDLFAAVRRRHAADTLFIGDTALADDQDPPSAQAIPMDTQMSPEFGRRHDVVVRAGAARRIAGLNAAIEETWTRATALPGSVRFRRGDELMDIVSSDRRLRRQQTHVRLSGKVRGYSVTAHYELAQSSDDSDGPFGLPAHTGDVAGEWAPSISVPRHAMTMTASARLPFGVRLAATADARSGLRYNIITGTDPSGLGSFTDRGGLQRNAGVLPPTRTGSLYASRIIQLRILKQTAIDVGIRADNLANRTNVISVGNVVATPLFGRPIIAAPGRSIRFWATLAR